MTNKISNGVNRTIIILVALATIFVFDFWLFSPRKLPEPDQTEKIADNSPATNLPSAAQTTEPDYRDFSPIPIKKAEEKGDEADEQKAEILNLKSAVDLSVPFTVQAPFAKWDDLHNEACEEAVLIMAKYWLNNQELSKEMTEQEILAAVQWQEQVFGGHYDLNVSDTVRLGNQYFGLEKIYFTSVKSINDIKYQLSQGNLVIAPMAGRMLGNPYYRQPGPPYHMVVVKGYNDKEVITNDPGTKRGADFAYSDDIFFLSLHDWPFVLPQGKDLSKDEKAEQVALQGKKMIIVVEKK